MGGECTAIRSGVTAAGDTPKEGVAFGSKPSMRRAPPFLVCILFATSTARAEEPSRSATYEVHFDDDLLPASGSNPYGEWLKLRPAPRRVMLLRPRTTFVPELVRTVQSF